MKCIIMAGGSGDRLWPLSRKKYPKQFMELKENRSLLQETVVRNMPYCDEFIIVTNAAYKFIVEGQMQVFQGLKYRCVYEESARNTTAAIGVISLIANPSELLYVVAADTLIEGSSYKDNVLQAMNLAKKGNIVVFGVEAKEPNTRFGYIRCEGDSVKEFKEKPSLEWAQQYVESGEYLWNSGMFLMCAGDFVQELKLRQPELYDQCKKMLKKCRSWGSDLVLGGEVWKEMQSISVEKAIFEQSQMMKVVKAEFSWMDIDGLEDVIPLVEKRSYKEVILKDCKNVSVINRARKQLIVGQQLQDMTIINTEDALYVAPKGMDSASMKDIIAENQQEYGPYFERNRVSYRSWGTYEILSQDNGFKVKKVTIYPGKTIYSHIHGYRSEHWSIVNGFARITLSGETKDYYVNESIYVPMGVAHQVSNPSDDNLIIIEVGIGNTIVESDMIHLKDKEEYVMNCPAESISRLEPAYKDYLWGGTKLRDIYQKKCDYDIVAESWELSAHPAGQSVIAEGKYKGMQFGDYIKKIDKAQLGWKCQAYDEFPILIKFIDAREKLSIQVHPDDEFALIEEGEYGKNEMWYIMDCDEGASLYCGFKHSVTEEEILKAIEQETLLELLNEVKVQKGDTIFIPTGTVHAIGAGILVCEIQQNSNSTYRIYDYGRKDKYGNGRELHLKKAMRVLNLEEWNHVDIHHNKPVVCEGYSKQILGQCKYFESTKIEVHSHAEIILEDSSFTAVVVIEGEGTIASDDKQLSFGVGDTYFIPAGRRKLVIDGACEMILTKV